ncbi:MAG: tetratricopeptide repeat protein [Actinomycetota bacterium]
MTEGDGTVAGPDDRDDQPPTPPPMPGGGDRDRDPDRDAGPRERHELFGDDAGTPAEAADERTTSRSEALVAILIVAATVAAAVVGYLQVWSSSRSDTAASLAQRDAIAATARQVRADQWSDVESNMASRALLAREQVDQTSLQSQVFGQPLSTADKLENARLTRQYGRFGLLANLVGREFTGIPIAGRLSEEQDPAFPTRFVNQVNRDAIRLRALQDASNDESSGWSGRASTYTAILTLFAVALYLLGFSLALPRSLGRWFVRGGVAFALVGVAWAAVASTGRPEPPSQDAAAAFADGTVALSTASDGYDSSGYREAIADLTRAIDARPDFARAYLNRSQATYFANSPTQGLGTVTSPRALRSAIGDLKHAVDLGLDNALALGNIGALSFQEAMVDRRPDLLPQALDFTRRVIAIDPDRPLWLYNVAVTQLASGRRDQAMDTYRAANLAARREPATAAFWTTGAMSALDVLVSHRPALGDEVLAAKELVIGGVFGGPSNTASSPRDLHLDLVVTPSLVQFAVPKAEASSIDPARDTVVADWYYDDPAGHGYAVLPEVSGKVELSVAGDGGWFNLQQYLTAASPPRCLPSGSYRVEVYVNGHLAGTATTREDFGSLATITDKGLNASFCIPTDWVRNKASTTGVSESYVAPGAGEGMAIIRAHLPGGQTRANLPGLAGIFVRSLAGAFLPPLTGPGSIEHFFFMGLAQQAETSFGYRGGFLRVGVGLDPGEGAVVIGVAFGPKTDEPGVQRVFQSFSSFQAVPTG